MRAVPSSSNTGSDAGGLKVVPPLKWKPWEWEGRSPLPKDQTTMTLRAAGELYARVRDAPVPPAAADVERLARTLEALGHGLYAADARRLGTGSAAVVQWLAAADACQCAAAVRARWPANSSENTNAVVAAAAIYLVHALAAAVAGSVSASASEVRAVAVAADEARAALGGMAAAATAYLGDLAVHWLTRAILVEASGTAGDTGDAAAERRLRLLSLAAYTIQTSVHPSNQALAEHCRAVEDAWAQELARRRLASATAGTVTLTTAPPLQLPAAAPRVPWAEEKRRAFSRQWLAAADAASLAAAATTAPLAPVKALAPAAALAGMAAVVGLTHEQLVQQSRDTVEQRRILLAALYGKLSERAAWHARAQVLLPGLVDARTVDLTASMLVRVQAAAAAATQGQQ